MKRNVQEETKESKQERVTLHDATVPRTIQTFFVEIVMDHTHGPNIAFSYSRESARRLAMCHSFEDLNEMMYEFEDYYHDLMELVDTFCFKKGKQHVHKIRDALDDLLDSWNPKIKNKMVTLSFLNQFLEQGEREELVAALMKI